MKNNIEVLDSNWLRDSNLFHCDLKNGDRILLTEREWQDLFTGDLLSVESSKNMMYSPIFDDGEEELDIIGFTLIGENKIKIKNLEDLKDYSERIRDYARVGNIYIHKNKKEYLKGIEFNGDEMVEYMTEELSEFDDDEVVIEILYPSGEPVFYHEGDMKQIDEDLERCW